MTEVDAPPLLEFRGARIDDVDSGPLLEGLDGVVRGPRSALVGDWGPLFRLLTRRATVVAGTVVLDSLEPAAAVASGQVGVALSSAPLPEGWRGREYVLESARLAGLGREAARAAQAVLARLGLERLAERPLRGLAPVERRALLLAHAVVTEPRLLVVEAPLDGLAPSAASGLRLVLERAATGRRLLVSTRGADAGSLVPPLLESCDEVLRLDARGRILPVAGAGAPLAPGRRCSLVLLDGLQRFADALVAAGITVERELLLDARAAVLAAHVAAGDEAAAAAGGPGGRLVLRIDAEAELTRVVQLAHELGAPLVELTTLAPGELEGTAAG